MRNLVFAGLALTLAAGSPDAGASQNRAEPARQTARPQPLPLASPRTPDPAHCQSTNYGWVSWPSGDNGGICIAGEGGVFCGDNAGNQWTEENPC